MIALAVDTSSREGSLALAVEGEVLGPQSFGRTDSHLAAIGRSLDSLLKRAERSIEAIDRIALVSGPGSFTGLRIGMAFVKGIQTALGVDLVVLSSLELLALAGAAVHRRICPIIDARKNEIYTAYYETTGAGGGEETTAREAANLSDRLRTLLPMQVVSPAALLKLLDRQLLRRPILFTGSGVAGYREVIGATLGKDAIFAADPDNQPSTVLLARLAGALPPLPPERIATLEPLYLRPSDARLKPLIDHRSYERH
jgi:tRNA threonylcarbamoyladenosine biosynthesis protein TsaB